MLLMLLTVAAWPSRETVDAAVEAAGNGTPPAVARPRQVAEGEPPVGGMPGERGRTSHTVS
ncbi:hypothetical protein JD77_01086 [Micromonospora olivasterospora]|uniref:Uncharacterized protein n=1 Tax=Micromonospora olivasterospora TaxID=1880 RepID=A0A562I5Q3_MICOL|nr:hypothetical protein JD77_01086 [Micromonospora olivasterospora]